MNAAAGFWSRCVQLSRATFRSWGWAVALICVVPAGLAQEEKTASLLEGSYSRKGADTCLACHDDQITLAVFRNGHGIPSNRNSPFGHGQLQCEACHGPGDAHSGRVRRGKERPALIEFGSDRATPVSVQNDMCLACHKSDSGVAWHASAHDSSSVACADCHTSHAARDGVLTTTGQAQVCDDCHSAQRIAGLKPFAHPVDEGKMNCGACHSIHDGDGEHQLSRPTLNQTCYQCHAEKRGPFVWEHAPVAEDCSVCHDAHGSNHPGMLTQRGPFLCQACHSQAGHPSLANDAGGLANASPSKYLLGQNCMNCHSQVHGSNHPSGSRLMR